MSVETTTDLSQELAAFDLAAELPHGTVLLEASAGTGKTWTIGSLVTRYVAEGRARLEQLLVVTFGRAASQELRERVRAQLVEAERELADDASAAPQPAQTPTEPASDLIALMRRWTPDERHLAHRRVAAALADFDAATIATTHQFCSLVLESLGVAGDTDSRARLADDVDDLVKETVDDLYLRAFAHTDQTPAFGYDDALAVARSVVKDAQAHLEPEHEPRNTPAGRRVSFARAVRAELDRRKRRLGVLSYDDLLTQLRDALQADDSPAAQRMRQRWSIVLVDEFQDTDPVQWEVLDRAFSGHATMVLIGDPKQAIYNFRGGDVTTYLQAARTALTRQTLAVNWRSDEDLLSATQQLLEGAALGDDRIVVRPVTAHHAGTRLAGAPHPAPFRIRVLRRSDLGKRSGALTVKQTRPRIAADLALDIRRLLACGATFDGRPLRPRDIAVISYRHADLADARAALLSVGVPAVIAGGGSVFATPAAVEWLTLLEALEQPHRSTRVRSAALTCFIGQTAAGLDAGGDDLTDDVAETVRTWAEVFAARGVAAVVEAATEAGMPARVLAEVAGERRLTDLRHIGEALHEEAVVSRDGLTSLLTWLREQVGEARDNRGQERTRRLDSDAAAVQLVTIHASKGLEYPVVYLPALGDRYVGDPVRPRFHDASERRCLDVGAGGGPDWREHCRRAADEDAGEWLRLLYVAVTRAQSQVVCWWAPTRNAVESPLHRLLMRQPGAAEVPRMPDLPSDDEVVTLFAQWRARGGPVPEPAVPAPPGDDPDLAVPPGLDVRRFTRSVDTTWRRSSYSSLARAGAGPASGGVSSEPETLGKDDEQLGVGAPVASVSGPVAKAAMADRPSPMAELPAGTAFGSLVHAVLEHADPEAADLRAELLTHIDEQRTWWPVDLDAGELADALVAVCDTPLGPLAGEPTLTLRGVGLRNRLREMEFELPLAGGDLATDGADVRLGELAPLLERHLPDGDPVRPYAQALRGPLGRQSLRGYLTGSIDVVLRLPGTPGGAGPRYLVVDYKTNRLGPPDRSPTALTYAPTALTEAMAHSDYPLQALLYAAVLHRFLRWRQPGYDPEQQLGGVLYLYLRGMCGPDTPIVDGSPCGVFGWRPPVALVTELSDLLDGRAPGRDDR